VNVFQVARDNGDALIRAELYVGWKRITRKAFARLRSRTLAHAHA
jgi:hypothetical protein